MTGIVAATLMLGAMPLGAQVPNEDPAPNTAPESGPAPEIAPAPEAPPEPGPELAPESDIPEPGDEEARATHLNELLERLSTSGEGEFQRLQSQIRAAWNQSGSASMDLLSRRADKAMEAEELDTALIHLNDLVRLAPDFAEGWNKRATVHFMKGDYGPSLEDIARTLELEPRHFGALSGLGIILDRIGDKRGALEAYRRAIAIHPHLEGAHEGIKKLSREVEGERL